MEYLIKSKNEMIEFAENLAKQTKKGNIILLNGDLGSGKTFFSNAFINYFNKLENREIEQITSPTFNMVKTYKTNNFTIYHFDLYRIKDIEEVYELDVEDAFENVSLIEWPDVVRDFLPKSNVIDINIKIVENNCRLVLVK
ncbi:MAG: tRNA (adenosine(37)-N6)-threonylcarbamoyltransferase complex ATPase subunit type 1 TsaE [Rickettsiales bacterium]|nr:tRNA (adenosine(37)-N6)-threonylcarbamoyltransferase complex ATPase subunit type 1 TsaE [Rickettsiales bacterium]